MLMSHVLTAQTEVAYHLISCFFTDNIDKMPFQVMKNDYVVVLCTFVWDLSDFRLKVMRNVYCFVGCSAV